MSAETQPTPGPESAPALPTGSGLGGNKLPNGIPYDQAIIALAQDIQELKARIAVQPLPNQPTGKGDLVKTFLETVGAGIKQFGPSTQSNPLMEKMFDMMLNHYSTLDRVLINRMGGVIASDVLKPQHVTVKA